MKPKPYRTGMVPYGWEVVRKPGQPPYLQHCRVEQLWIQNMANAYVNTEQSAQEIAETLDIRGVPTRRGGKWLNSVVLRIIERHMAEKGEK